MLKYSHPELAYILAHWPILIFMPTVLLMIAVLALVTRWWDRRDEAAREKLQWSRQRVAATAGNTQVAGRPVPAHVAGRPAGQG